MADFTRIATNIAALQSLNSLHSINTKLGVAQLRLSTGRRINSAGDDAAGLTIATKFDFKARGLGQVLSNIADAKSLITVAEGHLNNINDILTRMKTLATQAANDTLGEDERNAIRDELMQLNEQIDNEVLQAKWAGTPLLGGNLFVATEGGAGTDWVLAERQFNFQVGVGTGTADKLTFGIVNYVFTDGWNAGTGASLPTDFEAPGFNSRGLGVQMYTGSLASYAPTGDHEGLHSVSNQEYANALMDALDRASGLVSKGLSYIGATVNRLDYQYASLNVAKVNTEASWNRIMNADMAFEQLEATKYQILQQTAIAMLAQASMQPQSILGLFR